ncbi:MAG: hypothetical protein ACOH1K_03815 [Rhodoglobus sp.]
MRLVIARCSVDYASAPTCHADALLDVPLNEAPTQRLHFAQ